ncbi:hypothetical protein [Haloferax sulfurifontis]|uniref:Uncharacterized protein n=1 Tax=Haloferax sulfurifontis TaxID=255616 RepID=A0A830DZQ9_9EURY|nr:hypothetical protein [Haloferax sulfurifontis]GGC63414.1 hypothetical protein GCM10007209_26930 [Haloferax sulfurifontis]
MRVQTDDKRAVDSLPDGVESAVWAGDSGLRCTNPTDYEDFFGDDVDLSPVTKPDGREGPPTVVFEPGDELPLEMAQGLYSSFSDRVIAFDGDGNRLDRPDESENETAVAQWTSGLAVR